MKKHSIVSTVFLLFVASIALVSCKKTDPPVADIFSEADAKDPYTISFSVNATNADNYSWNFGDNKGTSTEKDPKYTYSMSGDYTVTLTAKGDGGEVTVSKKISISASTLEILTGGPAATGGKTWVLSKTATNNDGASSFAGIQYMPAPSNALFNFGLETEYDNEFTFFSNGNYTVNPKNGKVLAGAVYAVMTNTAAADPVWDLGLAIATYTAPSGAKFELKEGDLAITVREENPLTKVISDTKQYTFKNVKYITFTNNAYFGILTYNTTIIIRDITSTRMVASLLVSTLSPADYFDDFQKPSIMYTLSFDKK